MVNLPALNFRVLNNTARADMRYPALRRFVIYVPVNEMVCHLLPFFQVIMPFTLQQAMFQRQQNVNAALCSFALICFFVKCCSHSCRIRIFQKVVHDRAVNQQSDYRRYHLLPFPLVVVGRCKFRHHSCMFLNARSQHGANGRIIGNFDMQTSLLSTSQAWLDVRPCLQALNLRPVLVFLLA